MKLASDPPRRTIDQKIVILAPDDGIVPEHFRRAAVDSKQYDRLLSAMQRMRGAIYLKDGALRPSQLDREGRHVTPADRQSWHVLTVGRDGRVLGCSRYRRHDWSTGFDELGVRHAALAADASWGDLFRDAVRAEMSRARRSGIAFAEVGGWAVEESLRFTTEALTIALATYALARWLGGCIGLTTATVRNSSSQILRKIGGTPLDADGTAIPPYFDPQYGCQMEVLRFDSRRPSPRFQTWVETLTDRMASAVTVQRTAPPAMALVPYRAAQAGR